MNLKMEDLLDPLFCGLKCISPLRDVGFSAAEDSGGNFGCCDRCGFTDPSLMSSFCTTLFLLYFPLFEVGIYLGLLGDLPPATGLMLVLGDLVLVVIILLPFLVDVVVAPLVEFNLL